MLVVPFLTPAIFEQLLANGRRSAAGEELDPVPVVKLFTPDAAATWLLTEVDPLEPDRAFGLCDLGLGSPELGYVSLTELTPLRGRLNLPIEMDRVFVGMAPLSRYASAARASGLIVELHDELPDESPEREP